MWLWLVQVDGPDTADKSAADVVDERIDKVSGAHPFPLSSNIHKRIVKFAFLIVGQVYST